MSKDIQVVTVDPVADILEKSLAAENPQAPAPVENPGEGHFLATLLKSIREQDSQKGVRLAFEVDPQRSDVAHAGQYKLRTGLIPPHILKRIAGPAGDELVNQILQVRENHVGNHGRPRTSRFSIGFELEENVPLDKKSEEQAKSKKKEVADIEAIIWNCGRKQLAEDWHFNFSQFLKMITRDALTYGMSAVELVRGTIEGKEKIIAFRATDAGTIFRLGVAEQTNSAKRKEAIRAIARIRGEKIEQVAHNYIRDKYVWAQVVEGRVVQVFADDELVVYSFYPTTNVEFSGYPLTPIDQTLNAITTHINVTLHNKLYFQHGRAAKGMIVIQSDTVDEVSIQKIKAQFHQSINSVNNSWRTPVFSVGTEDNISWQTVDTSGRDAEFQYLSDSVARVVMGAFQISPEEVPGYAHLARGTNTQSLSESSNEYQLEASRDVGLRPLLGDVQDMFNSRIFPAICPEGAAKYRMVFAGIDHDSPEKEATRLSQDQTIHMTYNNVLEKVEKPVVPPEMGGELPLNPVFWQTVSPFLTVGQIMEHYMKIKGAAADPRYNYIRDQFAMQFQQLELQKAQMLLQQQMQQVQQMQQQMAQAQQQAAGIDPNAQDQGDGEDGQDDNQDQDQDQLPMGKIELGAQNYSLLEKTIDSTNHRISRALLRRHRKMVAHHMNTWKEESKKALAAAATHLTNDEKVDDKDKKD